MTITEEMVKAGAAAMCCQAQALGCAAKNKDSEFTTCMLSTFMTDARRCLVAALAIKNIPQAEGVTHPCEPMPPEQAAALYGVKP